jgi:hypothetical protein
MDEFVCTKPTSPKKDWWHLHEDAFLSIDASELALNKCSADSGLTVGCLSILFVLFVAAPGLGLKAATRLFLLRKPEVVISSSVQFADCN